MQETRIKHDSGQASAAAWARSRGYDFAGNRAVSTGPGATQSSAGVAIAVKHNVPTSGLLRPEALTAASARICARTLALGGGVPVVAISVYMVTGIGLTGENLDIMGNLLEFVGALGHMWFIAGDFNMDPAELKEQGFIAKLGGVVAAPPWPTCGKALLDYVILAPTLANFVDKVEVLHTAPVGPHHPVRLVLRGLRPGVHLWMPKFLGGVPFEALEGDKAVEDKA